MGNKRLCTLCVLMFLFAGFACVHTNAAVNIEGTLIKPASSLGALTLQTKDGVKSLVMSKNGKVQRGQVKLPTKDVSLGQLHCGDYIVAALNSKGEAIFVRASFGFIKGGLVRCDGRVLVLDNGLRVELADDAHVFLRGGSLGKIVDLKPGSTVACVVNALSNEAWEVYQTEPAALPARGVKPKITSLQYSPLGEISKGDAITVEMNGTAGGKASFEIRRLTALLPMTEITPGYYRGVVSPGSTIAGAPLVGYLSTSGGMASPVQAGRLVTIGASAGSVADSGPPVERPTPAPPAPKLVEKPSQPIVPKAIPVVPPKAQITVPVIDVSEKPEKAQEMEQIVLKYPQDGAIIKTAITIIGKASPNSKVSISITYTNGRVGLLKLSGNVATQTVAVGNDGVFRMSPIALDGPLATKGLFYTIKAYYVDRDDHGTAISVVTGGRI